MIEELQQQWVIINWVNYWKYTNTYDGNNNLTEALRQVWNGSNWLNSLKWTYTYIPTDVNEILSEVNNFSLSNNYPNPFNPTTIINYSVPEIEFVTLKVYDVLGNEIAVLVNKEMEQGSYEISFDATMIPSGIYFYRFEAGSFVETKKMVVMK
jgi:hypothetical protein